MTAAPQYGRRAPARYATRPLLLALVYGSFLVVIGAMVVALGVLVGAHFSAAAINTTAAHDRALVRLWADGNLTSADLDPSRQRPSRVIELQDGLSVLVERAEILHMEVRLPDGTVLASDATGLAGRTITASTDFSTALAGAPTAGLLNPEENSEALDFASSKPLLREYLPIVSVGGDVVAVVGIWRDASPILARLEATRSDIILVTAAGALVLAGILLLVFRAAQRRLTAQSDALLEATRRDPLTGLLNHGAVVAGLAARLEIARAAGAPMGLAIVDVDNFRLLNDTYGHGAGDAVLMAVSRGLGAASPAGTLIGRYGPDEFLLVSPPMAVEVAERAVEEVRNVLRETEMQFGDSERLPITVSAGLVTYPESAEAVTDLVMAATAAVAEAKASGGDAVRRAGARDERPEEIRGFSVLQGLVMAIDAKDRYTKRHSEDVARYALFLGERLGLDGDELDILRHAALLHDVGKVGIPDSLLRKPGRLSPDEREVFEQHVVLGDLIVRDLPHLADVRAGVRHHHERWDGTGYPDRLAGEGIPLVARIVAVADAFSAMTTTRPYRKALSVQEALRRLSEAAGTQLEERLVRNFVNGIETDANAPMPTDERFRPRLWTPEAEAA